MNKNSSWKTYRRLLGYAWRYKGRLCLGVLCGMLAGASLIGVLAQANKMLSAFGENKPPDEIILTVEKDGQRRKYSAEQVREILPDNKKVDTVPEEGGTLTEVEPVITPIGSQEIPPWAKEFLTDTLGIELYNAKGQPTGIVVIPGGFRSRSCYALQGDCHLR